MRAKYQMSIEQNILTAKRRLEVCPGKSNPPDGSFIYLHYKLNNEHMF